MPIIDPYSIPFEPIPDGEGVSRKVLISPKLGPNFAMRQFSIAPGGYMPLHTNLVEHEQYVLKGQAQVQLGEELKTVKAGDVLFMPAGLPHSYRNTGSEAFEFLCLVPNKEDRIDKLSQKPAC